MQAQRDKEQRLIDTGEQYKRAIQLFVAKAKRYPGRNQGTGELPESALPAPPL